MKPNRSRATRLLMPAALAAALVAGTAACDSDTTSEGTSNSVRTLTPEAAASSPSAEAASASPSPRTQRSNEASVSVELERVRAEAAEVLEGAEGKGNAVKDVSVTGRPVTEGEDFRSALVRVTNSTQDEAFYAVRVEFVDAEGKVLDSVVLGFEDAPPGRTVSKQASSRKAAGVTTFPRIAQAERG